MPLDRSPWTFHSEREVYRNPWIRVVERTGTRPDGRSGIYGIVQPKIAVGVVPVLDPGPRVVLVGQWRVPHDRWSWELPEGGVDPGEDADVAIARELEEETGYRAATWSRLGGEVHLSNSHSDEVGLLYLASDLTHVGAHPDGDEVLEVITPTLDEALALVDDGTIVDSLSIIGLLRLARR